MLENDYTFRRHKENINYYTFVPILKSNNFICLELVIYLCVHKIYLVYNYLNLSSD